MPEAPADSGQPPAPGRDPRLEAVLKEVLRLIYKDHPLTANQILSLASELQRLGVHRLVEEHLRQVDKRPPPQSG